MQTVSLDARTLLFSVSLIGFLAAGLSVGLARTTRHLRLAVVEWSRAMLCVGVAFLLIFLRGHVPGYVPYVIGNAMVMAFALFALLAYRRLFGVARSARPIALLYVAQVASLVAFQVLETPRDIAVVTLCTALAVEFAMIAALIAGHQAGTTMRVRWIAAGTMTLFSVLFATRVIVTLAGGRPSIDPAAQTGVQIGTLLAASVAIIAATVVFMLMVHDLQYRRAMEGARRDDLTGLHSRRALFEEFAALGGDATGGFALVMVDIDHFKAINDRHGHLGGDAVLARVGELLRSSIRGTDIAARYGGEEFCVLLRGCDETEAGRFAERLVADAGEQEVQLPGGTQVRFTISAGYAASSGTLPQAGALQPVVQVLERADGALYGAKRSGRNRAQAATADPGPGAALAPDIMAV
ncbi:MAG: GGDEF domain-containing protein [Burkholderiaceae bacterium]|nr:GGDEF domain-containing protein [Burkholderiaceae bacterium]